MVVAQGDMVQGGVVQDCVVQGGVAVKKWQGYKDYSLMCLTLPKVAPNSK